MYFWKKGFFFGATCRRASLVQCFKMGKNHVFKWIRMLLNFIKVCVCVCCDSKAVSIFGLFCNYRSNIDWKAYAAMTETAAPTATTTIQIKAILIVRNWKWNALMSFLRIPFRIQFEHFQWRLCKIYWNQFDSTKRQYSVLVSIYIYWIRKECRILFSLLLNHKMIRAIMRAFVWHTEHRLTKMVSIWNSN